LPTRTSVRIMTRRISLVCEQNGDRMRLIVVGNGGGTGFTASASGGYLVTHGKASLLMECGPGVATQLAQYTPLEQIMGVVISHMHYDNFADLLTLALTRYTATVDLAIADYSDELGRGRIHRLHVYLPPGGVEFLRRSLPPTPTVLRIRIPGFRSHSGQRSRSIHTNSRPP